jgi:hypothetical protein
MKKDKRVEYNPDECWGGLKNPLSHTAAFGARTIDNASRKFEFLLDRITATGEKKVLDKLKKWVSSRKVLNLIAKNTKYVQGLDAMYYTLVKEEICKGVFALLHVKCAGGYCYMAAYADRSETVSISVTKAVSSPGEPQLWRVKIPGLVGDYPYIQAESGVEAANALLNYLHNELNGAEDMIAEGWK